MLPLNDPNPIVATESANYPDCMIFPSLIALFLIANPVHAETRGSFHDESGAGIVVTTGNSKAQNYNLSQVNTYGWNSHLLKFEGRYLDASSNDELSARKWSLQLRYDREFSPELSLFYAQTLESDIFSGYTQRYHSDLGGKYFIIRSDSLDWVAEAGARYTVENRIADQVRQIYTRLYSEANRKFNKNSSLKLTGEYLQNLTNTADHQLNGELSLAAMLNEVFSVKTGYGIKYRSILLLPATQRVDTQFTSAFVASF